MKHIFWNDLKIVKDTNNPFSTKYVYENGDCFYIEPIFYTKLLGMISHNEDKKDLILEEMEKVVRKNHKVIFTGDFEYPQTEVEDDFIILEIEDITNRLMIFVEDKSRGSDYGD